MHSDVIPVVNILLLSLYDLQFLLRVVNERAKLLYLAFAQGIAEQLRYLTLDVTRGILDDVQKSLVLAVYVCEEMLRTLWQVEYSGEVYYLCCSICYCWECCRKQLQIVHVFFYFVSLVHCVSVFADAKILKKTEKNEEKHEKIGWWGVKKETDLSDVI